MLYGGEKIEKDILRVAYDYAKKNNLKLVFASVVGSISKGTNYVDSDYDTRFLFLKEDFPNRIYIPSDMKEEELVLRLYPDKELVWEWIPFWELTSFIQFLKNPSFKEDFSVGLYNIVGWTFQSPYQWDPYGIRNKIMPLIDDIFIKEYEIIYHKKYLDEHNVNISTNKIYAKDYIYALHSALTIRWSIINNTQPPINLEVLLLENSDEELYNSAMNIVNYAKEKSYMLAAAREKIEIAPSYKIHATRDNIIVDRNSYIDRFIDKWRVEASKFDDGFKISYEEANKIDNRLTDIYKLIERSLKIDIN